MTKTHREREKKKESLNGREKKKREE